MGNKLASGVTQNGQPLFGAVQHGTYFTDTYCNGTLRLKHIMDYMEPPQSKKQHVNHTTVSQDLSGMCKVKPTHDMVPMRTGVQDIIALDAGIPSPEGVFFFTRMCKPHHSLHSHPMGRDSEHMMY